MSKKTAGPQSLFALLISSALLCAICLSFAIGVYDWNIFLGYFRHPLIFLLNWLPVLLVQGLLLCLLNRQWAAFFITAAVFLTSSIGDFFKLRFRDEPFLFQDLGSIQAGLSVAGNYGVSLNKRILLALVLVLLLTLLLCRLCREKLKGGFRAVLALFLLAGMFPLWRFVYSDDSLYRRVADSNLILETWDSNEYFVATGFPYPFLHSITASRDIPPSGYRAEEAAALLSACPGESVPEDRRVNVLVLQLESFTDLEAMGVTGISPDTYATLRSISEECLCGRLIANVIGGGTIDTERCFLSGSYGLQSYRKASSSYIRWLNAQGYHTSFGHPNRAFFYNRQNIADYLGFQEAWFNDNRYGEITNGEWRCDAAFLPDVFSQFREELLLDEPVFSFRITLQGHAPYNSSSYDEDGHFWSGDAAADSTKYEINNYLSMVAETQRCLADGLNSLRELEEPCVVLLYGDHNPYFDSETAYQDLGLSFDMGTEEGFLNYYGTPWLLWANSAAREVIPSSLSGTGATVSPGYLMNVLFHELGWTGNAFMHFTDSVLARLPVVSTNGCYLEDGRFVTEPDAEGQQLLHDYECVQFYYRANPAEAEK